jgi:prepilin-type processing-associated H-X9-DG protein
MYAADNDDRFAPAARWMDAIRPLVKGARNFHCPAPELRKLETAPTIFGYAMSRYMDSAVVLKLEEPELQPLVYDSTDLTWNANEYLPSLPSPGRHDGASVVAYADGHVRAVRPKP